MKMDQDNPYVQLAIEVIVTPPIENKQKEEITRLQHNLKSIKDMFDNLQVLLNKHAKELESHMTDITNETRINDGKN